MLIEALQRRGYPLRIHLEEEGWTRRKLTVVDLDDEQRTALREGGGDRLRALLQSQERWTFPALDIEQPLPRRADLILAVQGGPVAAVVAPGANPALRELAERLVAAIEQRHQIRLPLLDDDVQADALDKQPLIVVGGSHENRLAKLLALRHQTLFVDAAFPGEHGWVVTSLAGLNAAGHNALQLAAASEHHAHVLDLVLRQVQVDADRLFIGPIHTAGPEERLRAQLPDWPAYAAGLPRRLPQLQGQRVEAPQEIGALADLLALGLDSGGAEKNFYNVAPIDIAVACAHYYQLTGEPRALELFHALLFRLADYYLKTPGGASYPADLDFRLGHLILYFARLEHEPIFTGEDRLILANLLLACTRSIYEYMLKFWPIKPGVLTRHNHETFPARSLLFAADYFGRYGVPDAAAWRAHADLVFADAMWQRSKQQENANGYEGMVFTHGASYLAYTGRGLEGAAAASIGALVQRQLATTDNFFRPVDYGDTNVSMSPADAVLARIAAAQTDDPALAWYAEEGPARTPQAQAVLDPVHSFPGLRLGRGGRPAPSGDWEHCPLDPLFTAEAAPHFPAEFAFDKLAFRTGWGDDDQYLLLEGVGNRHISHAHNDVNGIVRFNHLGRHWLVSNGYGRRVGVSNVAESFSSRVLGPEDHNMLVMRRGGEIVHDVPVCSALVRKGRQGPLLYATGVVLDYAGVDWFRTLLVLAGQFVLVVDQVRMRTELEAAHVEWNALGRATPHAHGFRLEQQGVFCDVTSPSGWRAEHGVADQSASWQGVLEGGRYPYATFPLQKLRYHVPQTAAEGEHTLGTLLAATRGEPKYSLAQPEPQRLIVSGPEPSVDIRVRDGDLAVTGGGGRIEVRFDPAPSLPGALRGLATRD